MKLGPIVCGVVGAVAVTAAGAAEPASEGLQEVVVTAQKRAEDVQTTAISIGVVTGEEMARKAQTTLDSVLRTVPGVEIQGLAQGAQLYIRGVGSSIDPGFADPSIALMVDGAYNGRTESVTSGAYDVSRVEVLRGPQGTLYGRNASGGSVNVITNNPTLGGEVSGYARAQVGDYSLRRLEAAVNLPVGDALAFRIAGFRDKRDGYVDDGSYDSDAWGVRLKMLYKPTDWLSMLVKVDHYREQGAGANTLPVAGSAGNLFFPPPFFVSNFDPSITNGPPFRGGPPVMRFPNGWVTQTAGDPWSNNPEHVPGYIDRKADTVQVQIDADLGFATLTLLPAYSHNQNNLVSSFLFGSVLPFAGPTYTVNANYGGQPADTKYKSVEARLTSNGDGPLKYIGGLYYLRSDGGAPLSTQPLTTNTGQSGTFSQTILPGSTTAAFGQVTYSLTDTFRLTGGLRVSKDKNSQRYSVTVGTASTGDQGYTSSQSSTTYKLGIEADLADESMLYAHVATGFKQGGISTTVPPTPFRPEHLTSFEVGVKNRFLDDKVQLNVAAFHYKYEDYQFSTFQALPVGNTSAIANFPVISNAGATNINGGEVELDWLPWERGHIRATVTYLDAKYGTAVLPNNPFVNQGNYQLGGTQIQNAPDWSANLGIDHAWPFAGGVLSAGVNTHVSTGYFTSPEQYLAGAYQGSFTRTDFTLNFERGDWTLGAWLKNVENDAQTTYVFPAYRRFITSPRTFGVSGSVKF